MEYIGMSKDSVALNIKQEKNDDYQSYPEESVVNEVNVTQFKEERNDDLYKIEMEDNQYDLDKADSSETTSHSRSDQNSLIEGVVSHNGLNIKHENPTTVSNIHCAIQNQEEDKDNSMPSKPLESQEEHCKDSDSVTIKIEPQDEEKEDVHGDTPDSSWHFSVDLSVTAAAEIRQEDSIMHSTSIKVEFQDYCRPFSEEAINNTVIKQEVVDVQLHSDELNDDIEAEISDDSISHGARTRSMHKNQTARTLPTKKTNRCTICKKLFRRLGNLQRHMVSHTAKSMSNTELQCKLCNITFNLRSQLVIHMMKHTGEKPFKCDQCNRSYRIRNSLYYHKKTHQTERLFQCDICQFKFRVKQALVAHQKYHSRGISLTCTICNRTFARMNHLGAHIQTHGKLFTCDICKQTFNAKFETEYHIWKHIGYKRYKCPMCPRAYYHNTGLKTHLKRHTGGDFKCSQCKYSFVSDLQLRNHIKIHEMEKKFKCSYCKRAYLWSTSLNRHMAQAHPSECLLLPCANQFTNEASTYYE